MVTNFGRNKDSLGSGLQIVFVTNILFFISGALFQAIVPNLYAVNALRLALGIFQFLIVIPLAMLFNKRGMSRTSLGAMIGAAAASVIYVLFSTGTLYLSLLDLM